MKCVVCGNFGIRNGQYCECVHGQFLQVQKSEYKVDDEMEKIMDEMIKQYDGAFRRLSEK